MTTFLLILHVPGGGLSAVIWTDLFQTVLMVIGAGILMVFRYGNPGQVWNSHDFQVP